MTRVGPQAAGRVALRMALCSCAAALAAGCGPGGSSLDTGSLHLPVSPSPAVRGRATLYTSPDGGIYRNPDPIAVQLVTPVDPAEVARRLGASGEWRDLEALGPFTAVGLVVRNGGRAFSDPELRGLQIASDLAPPGADAGAARRWYHPLYPLAALSDVPVSDTCAIHLDPGQSATAVLLYPPIRRVPAITWGQYADFALSLPVGGALRPPAARLSASRCTRPPAPGDAG